MSTVRDLRSLVEQRLAAAAQEIFRLFERTVAEYEEQLRRQQKLLDAVLQPRVRIHRAEVQHLSVRTEDVIPQKLESSCSLDLEEPPHVKEEPQEIWIRLVGEELPGFASVAVKTEEEAESLMETGSGADAGVLHHSSGHQCDTQSHLKPHVRVHREKPLRSPFYSSSLTMSCRGEKPYRCALCRKTFARSGDLVRHVRTHTGEKPFGCLLCLKRYTRKDDLRTHMRIHTGEKPFSCTLCGTRFTWSTQLKRHRCGATQLQQKGEELQQNGEGLQLEEEELHQQEEEELQQQEEELQQQKEEELQQQEEEELHQQEEELHQQEEGLQLEEEELQQQKEEELHQQEEEELQQQKEEELHQQEEGLQQEEEELQQKEEELQQQKEELHQQEEELHQQEEEPAQLSCSKISEPTVVM